MYFEPIKNMLKRFGVIVALLFVEGSLASAAFAGDDNFGAIATSETSGRWGLTYDYATREEAESKALAQCRSDGTQDCQVRVWFKNACGAVAENQNYFGWGLGDSRAEAEKEAMKALGGKGEIVAWSCTTR